MVAGLEGLLLLLEALVDGNGVERVGVLFIHVIGWAEEGWCTEV